MPQKSRNVAATYASKSKDRKTKKRLEPSSVIPDTASTVRTTQSEERTSPASAPAAPTRTATPTRTPVPGPAQRAPRYRSTTQIIAADYQYVLDDLRHILIVSGVLLAIIVVLAFVLH